MKLGRFARALRGRFWKPPVSEEVQREIAAHLEARIAEYQAQGMSAEDARAEALRRFGDVGDIAATMRTLGHQRDRAEHRREYTGDLWQDLRYALRQLRGSPGFAAAAVLTLALGIGASTAIFSIANAILLRPMPYADPSRLIRVFEKNPTTDQFSVTGPNYLDWRAQNHSFSDMAAFSGSWVSLTGDGDPERLRAWAVTPSFFSVIGVPPLRGRAFSEDEGRPGAPAQALMISRRLWARRFASDPGIVGRSINLDGVSYRVIGVITEDLEVFNAGDIWLPLQLDPAGQRGNRLYGALGRLKPGVTREQAQADLDGISRRLRELYPVDNKDWGVNLTSLDAWIVGPALTTRVLVLLGAVALLLLMACVNVANLLLARAGTRLREMGLRAALGAGRGRIVRQLLTESLVLSLVGALLGVVFTILVVPAFRSVAGQAIPRLDTLAIDWRVLGFGVAASLLTGLLFGAAPAAQLSRFDLDSVLRGGGRIAGVGRVRGALIAGSVGLAMLLLVGAGLLRESFVTLMRVDPGFRAEGVLTGQLTLPASRYPRDSMIGPAVARILEAVEAVPGVTSAGVTNLAPFSGGGTSIPFTPLGEGAATGDSYRQAAWRTVSPDYFRTLGITLQRGRLFTAADRRGAAGTIVITDSLAKLGWPGGDALGKQVRVPGSRDAWTVVGIVSDLRDQQLEQDPSPLFYLPHAQVSLNTVWLMVRTTGDPMSALPAVTRAVQSVDPLLPIGQAQPLADIVVAATAQPRLTMMVFALFGAAALALALVGIYGLIAYSVSQRTRELGVRLALGARPSQIIALVVRRGVVLALVGVGVGLFVARVLAGYLRSIVFGVSPTDLATYAGVAVLLILCAVLASLLPAARASRLQPTLAIRSD